MSEVDDTPDDPVIEDSSEISQDQDPEVSSSKDPTNLGEDISADELGIDLDSLKLDSSNVLGRAKPKPTLTASASDKRAVGRPAREDEGLFAWCEQFAYTPGVDYLKLHRLYPKVWEGMSIGGFVEEVYEPIDEHWLADRWGGGSYQIEAYQRDSTGRSRKTQVKHIEISGLPKAFMGSDGKPHNLPSAHMSRSHSSRRSSDVLKRRMGLGRFRNSGSEGFGGGYDDDDDDNVESIPRSRPQPTPRPSNVDQPLADAGTLYKVLQESKKTDNDALGVLREAQKDVHLQMQATAQQQAEMYKAMLDQQKEEMRRVREESKMAAENSSAPFKELLQFMSIQGNDTSSKSNLDALKSAHDSAINSLTREHSSHVENLRQTFEARQKDLADELNRLRSAYTQDVERIRQDYLEKEKTSKDDAFRNYQAQLQVLQTQSSDLRERHRDELNSVTREKNELINALRQDLSELRTTSMTKEHEARLAQMERENTLRQEFQTRERQLMDRINTLELNYSKSSTEREEALRKDFLEREKDLKEKLLTLESSTKASILEERQRMKEEFEEKYESKLESIKTSYEAKMDALKESSELKVTSAEKESKSTVDAMRKEIRAQYESQIAKLESTIDSLKKEYQVREQLSIERSKLEQDSAQKDRENQRLIMESNAQSREALAEMSRKQLEARVKELAKDLEITKRERDIIAEQSIPESTDPFDQLEKLNAIKERLKQHGFIDSTSKEDEDKEDKEPEEEKPKNFLDKVLQYGPQFVGPILQRIDAATAVAQQAVAQQQQEAALKSRDEVIQQQRLLEQERQASVDREDALRQRREMLMQRRAEREQEFAIQEAQQREIMAQQMAAQRGEPQANDAFTNEALDKAETIEETENRDFATETTPTEDPQMAENDGYTQLAEYLDKSIADKKSASSIINEIKMALMMGMFSRDVLNDVLATDFDELVRILSDIKPSLRSPKARITLKAVMEGVSK